MKQTALCNGCMCGIQLQRPLVSRLMDAEQNLGFAAYYLCGTVVLSAGIAPSAERNTVQVQRELDGAGCSRKVKESQVV